MKKAVLCIAFLLLMAAPSWAQFNIYLKNGSVIKGVSNYRETDGKLMFQSMGGTLGIPLEDVLKIEEARTGDVVIEPPAAPARRGERGTSRFSAPSAPRPSVRGPPVAEEKEPDTGPVKQRLAGVNERLAEVEAKVAEYESLKKEYNRVRLRIEVLFQKGIKEARLQGGDPAKWFEFLSAQEQKWAQLNTMKKKKLAKQLGELEKEAIPLIGEKEALLREKESLEAKLRALEDSL